MKEKIKILSMDKRIRRLVVWLEVISAIILFSNVTINVFQIEIMDLIKYLAFQICGMLIPGFVLASILKRRLPIVTRTCLAYALGYALNIVEYFIGTFARWIPYQEFSVCIFIISVALILHDRKKYMYLRADKKVIGYDDTLLTVSILLLLLFLNLFAYACHYKDTFRLPHDLSWWINNSVALKLKFPPDNLFMAGTKLYYHYFSSMQIAYSSLVTGIDIVSLSIPLYAMTKTMVMIGAADFCLEVMDIHGWTRFWGYLVILFTTGLESDSIVTFFHHILLMPFGFDIGFAFGIYFLLFFFLQWRSQRFDLGILTLTTISWMMCVGAKAPIAAALLLFPGLTCIYWLIQKKYLMGLSYGICILGVFILISIGCVGMLSVVNGDSGAYYLSLHSINDLRVFAGKEKSLLFAVLERWIAMHPAIFVLFILSLIDLWMFKKDQMNVASDGPFIFFASITYLWGIFLWRIISADGSSEMYYGMAAYIPAYFVIGRASRYQCTIKQDRDKHGIENALRICVCLLGVYYFMFDPYGGVGAVEYAHDAIHAIKEISLISSQEMDGLRWIRDNTDRNVVVVSDRSIVSGIDTYYLYGIVSERQQYIEGTHMLRFSNEDTQKEIDRRKELVQDMYDNAPGAIEELKDDGVEYIVQTKSITPGFQYDERYVELVATSDDINVYKIK